MIQNFKYKIHLFPLPPILLLIICDLNLISYSDLISWSEIKFKGEVIFFSYYYGGDFDLLIRELDLEELLLRYLL